MTKLPWMSRSDRRRWKAAQSVADLGELMASWLEGDIKSWPGYMPRCGPDEETTELIPVLAELNRAGFVTTQSQPGLEGIGADGAWWEQRAAVEGVITDQSLHRRLKDAAVVAGLMISVDDIVTDSRAIPIVVTTRDGTAYTTFGSPPGHGEMTLTWSGVSNRVWGEIAAATRLTIAAPEYGDAGQRLWAVLRGAVAGQDTPTRNEGN